MVSMSTEWGEAERRTSEEAKVFNSSILKDPKLSSIFNHQVPGVRPDPCQRWAVGSAERRVHNINLPSRKFDCGMKDTGDNLSRKGMFLREK